MTSLITGFNKADNDYFAKHFTVLEKNVERLEDATVVCLVETHYLLPVATKNSWLIEKINEVFTSAYVVLVEGCNRGQVISGAPQQAPFISSRNISKGWDSAKDLAKTQQLIDTVRKYLITLKMVAAHIDRWRDYKDDLWNMLNSVQNQKMRTAASQDLEGMLNQQSALDYQKLHNMFSCILKLKLFEVALSASAGINGRNQSFIEAHRDEIQDSKKVISIVRKLHLFADEFSKPEDLEIIKTYLGQHRYAIIEANTDMESVKSVRRTLEIQRAGGKVWYLLQKIQEFAKTIFNFVKRSLQPKSSLAEKQHKEMTLVELKDECLKFLNEFKVGVA